MYSKISNETRKMIIPWLWGRYTNLNHSKYVYYGSLIEGARVEILNPVFYFGG